MSLFKCMVTLHVKHSTINSETMQEQLSWLINCTKKKGILKLF